MLAFGLVEDDIAARLFLRAYVGHGVWKLATWGRVRRGAAHSTTAWSRSITGVIRAASSEAPSCWSAGTLPGRARLFESVRFQVSTQEMRGSGGGGGVRSMFTAPQACDRREGSAGDGE